MHQPRPIPHKKGMGGVHGEIIHHLGLVGMRHIRDHAVTAVGAAHAIACLKLSGRHPSRQQDREGVLRCGCDRLTIYRDDGDDRVGVRSGGRNGDDIRRARSCVIGRHRIARLDLADGSVARCRGDVGVNSLVDFTRLHS